MQVMQPFAHAASSIAAPPQILHSAATPLTAAPAAAIAAPVLVPASATTTSATQQAADGAGQIVSNIPKPVQPMQPVDPSFHTPSWVKDAIFYQIFPDRFDNGDTANDPAGTVPWGSPPTNTNFMGGDLEGVQQKLGYLKKLGVNAIYLNPIFTSPSNHKYDTVDYMHVDPHFGGNSALKSMVNSAHSDGMHVILDGVFDHTSDQNPWFKNVEQLGQKSPYWNWYTVYHWPIQTHPDAQGIPRSSDYKDWFNYATLPVLNKSNPAVKSYFLTGPDSVVKHWIKDYHIDGWRMDVADDPSFPAGWWQSARGAIKSADPNAYLAAEDWHDASQQLKGDSFDGAMNYKYFQQPCVDFFAKKDIDSDQFVQRLQNTYPLQAKEAMLNLLDSHDTPRFITNAGGDWYRLRPAAIFQMTYVGAPMIYYGDEVGMQGQTDPDDRRAFPWKTVQSAPADSSTNQLHSLYQKLISIRKSQPELRRGSFTVLETHDQNKTIAYRRAMPGNKDAIIAINNDVVGHGIDIPTKGVVPNGTAYTDALTGKTYTATNGQIVIPNMDGNYGAILIDNSVATAVAKANAQPSA